MTELAQGAAEAAEALAPEEGSGAAGLAAAAESAVAPLEHLAPELSRAGGELRDVELRLRETASELKAFLLSLEAEPDRLEQVEGELERLSDLRRRFGCDSYGELLERAQAARSELAAIEEGVDPATAAVEELAAAERRMDGLATELRRAREAAADPFAAAVAAELHGIGMGEGEFRAELARVRSRCNRRGQGGLPDPPEPRASVRARGRDGLRRRALPDCARDRRRRRRAHDDL